MTPTGLTRRHVIAAGATLAATTPLAAMAGMTHRTFPKGFLWGTATAAHQVEGNNTNSDWWLLEGLPGTFIRERSGVACDHYNRYPQDIATIAAMGLSSYRFSIEWARIEPTPGRYDKRQLDHYRDMLRVCRRHGLHTVVTLHHFTSPAWLAARGGFENPATVAAFAAYAEAVLRHCGDLIDTLCTFNEANLTFSDFIPTTILAPMLDAAKKASGSSTFRSFLFDDASRSKPIVRACHAAARRATKAVRPDLPVGLTLAMSDIQDAPGAPGAGVAERSKRYDVWLELARTDEFVGVQNYTRERFDAKGAIPPPAGAVRTQLDQEYYPAGLAGAVRYAASVARTPILVTENGIGTEDDALRGRYITEALTGLQECIAAGIDVRGYWHWSAMDNFEWSFGYGPKFGLMAVDRVSQVRTLKPSASLYSAIARANAVSA
ncbi:family 1 glycosylhydrolase [Sphingomonas sp. CLY1604]|uniref:family 1 glycosylhydrolase n=1 Tax=Sphingomonas sp. CLY1604 TaxID=3457786 RepID=UPI003FD7D837